VIGNREVPAMSPHDHPIKKTLGLPVAVGASPQPLSSGKKAK
jgi:hypothetical protein